MQRLSRHAISVPSASEVKQSQMRDSGVEREDDGKKCREEEEELHFHSRAVMCLTSALITFNKLRILCLDHKQRFYFDLFLSSVCPLPTSICSAAFAGDARDSCK